MSYFNERRVVESIILPLSFIPIVSGGVAEEYAEHRDATVLLLKGAMDEVLPTMDHKTYQRVFKRAREAVFEGFLKQSEQTKQLVVKAGLALYYFLDNMLEQGAYAIQEGSQFEKALNEILPAMQDWLLEVKLDQSAFKEGKRMLTRLQSLGYYQDVQWVTVFTPATKEV